MYMIKTTTLTFHVDAVKREGSAFHDLRSSRDPVKDKKYFELAGHEHIIPEYCHLNRDLYTSTVEDFYDQTFTKRLGEWSDKQKHRDKRLQGGIYLPPDISKADAPIYAEACRIRLRLMARDIPADYNPFGSDTSDPKVAKAFTELLAKHPKAKKLFWEQLLARFESGTTAGEAYLKDLRAGVESGGRTAQRPVYGMIVQFGSCDDPDYTEDRNSPYWKEHADMLEEWLKKWQKANPDMQIIRATIHMDEKLKPPHLHLVYVPVVESKRGKPLKVSMNAALQEQGYKAKDKSFNASRDAFGEWCKANRALMETVAHDYGYTVVAGAESEHQEKSSRAYREMRASTDATLKHQRKEIRLNKATMAEQQQQIATLTPQVDALKQAVDAQKDALAKINDAQATLDSLNSQATTTATALQAVDRQVTETLKSFDPNVSLPDTLEDKVALLKTTVDDAKADYKTLQDNTATERDNLADVKAKVFGQQETLDKSKAKLKKAFKAAGLKYNADDDLDVNVTKFGSYVTKQQNLAAKAKKTKQDWRTDHEDDIQALQKANTAIIERERAVKAREDAIDAEVQEQAETFVQHVFSRFERWYKAGYARRAFELNAYKKRGLQAGTLTEDDVKAFGRDFATGRVSKADVNALMPKSKWGRLLRRTRCVWAGLKLGKHSLTDGEGAPFGPESGLAVPDLPGLTDITDEQIDKEDRELGRAEKELQ